MRYEIKRNKEIKINGNTVLAKQVKVWKYDNEKDNPFTNDENKKHWDALLSIKNGWEILDANKFLNLLDNDFEYDSYWVNDTMRGFKTYKNYILGKFETISNSNSRPKITIVILREGLIPVSYTYALFLEQKENIALLLLEFNKAKISKMHLTDPDIYCFDTYRVGLLDDNGEPRMFKHSAQNNRTGKTMTKEEIMGFAVQIIITLLEENNFKIRDVNINIDKEKPNISYYDNGTLCFIKLYPFLPPQREIDIPADEQIYFSTFAYQNFALAIAVPIGLYCMDTDGQEPINGSTFAAKINEKIVC